MKRVFFTLTFLCLFVLGAHNAQAQGYFPGYYGDYGDEAEYQAYAQQYDPYYDLHVMHYQLYLPQYQAYLGYPYCCVAGGIVVGRPVAPRPPVIAKPNRPMVRRK